MTSYITQLSEGFGRPEGASALPLDVKYDKLIDWLVERKFLVRDWPQRLHVVQDRAAELPSQGVREADAPLDYTAVVARGSQLAESAERNMLGQLKGDAALWQKVVAVYEKGGLWYGEAAQALARNTDFEVPALRRTAARCQQQLQDLAKRRDEARASAVAAAAAFEQECQELGITGADISSELRKLGGDLAQELQPAVGAACSPAAADAVAYYEKFVAYAHGRAVGEEAAPLLPSLQALQAGEPLPGAENAQSREDIADAKAATSPSEEGTAAAAADGDSAPGEISWDIDFSALDSTSEGDPTAAPEGQEGGTAIDFSGLDDVIASGGAAENENGTPGVQWDVQIDSTGDDVDGGGAAGAIDWDVSVGEEGQEGTSEQDPARPTPCAASPEDATVDGTSAVSLAVHALIAGGEARTRLLDDLCEVQAFLQQRVTEAAGSTGDAVPASAPQELQQVSAAAVEFQLKAVSRALTALTGGRVKQLQLITSSSRHRERLAKHLRQQAAKEGKFKQAALDCDARREETQRKLMACAPQLAAILKRTRALKLKMESSLSAALGGREVNIIGEINNVLS